MKICLEGILVNKDSQKMQDTANQKRYFTVGLPVDDKLEKIMISANNWRTELLDFIMPGDQVRVNFKLEPIPGSTAYECILLNITKNIPLVNGEDECLPPMSKTYPDIDELLH